MQSFDFTETAPVTRAGGPGPGPKPSPFEEPVKSIAGQTVEVEIGGKKVTKPKTLKFIVDYVDDKKLKTLRGQLQNMGKRCDPEVTVHVDVTPETREVKGKPPALTGRTIVKFWTTAKIHRARKPKTDTPPPATQTA